MLYILSSPSRLPAQFLKDALPCMDAARRTKTLRLLRPADRLLSAATWMLLRLALWEECGRQDMPLWRLEANGKPVLVDGPQMSLSRCASAVVCALDAAPVGVDVEPWDSFAPGTFHRNMLERLFSPAEITRIQQAADAGQTACALWTAKESFVKCSGMGLPLSRLPHLLDGMDIMRQANQPDRPAGHPHMELHSLPNIRITVAVCREAAAAAALPCRMVSPAELCRTVRTCLHPA